MKIPSDLMENLIDISKNYPDSDEFIKSFLLKPYRGIRVNTLKCSKEKIEKFLKDIKPTPFCENGYYISDDFKPGNDFLHHCGAYYVQEPSATSAVSIMGVEKGDYVLDLCAAPGGKSTQIAALLKGTGLIWSNEPVVKRTAALMSNFERMGIVNGVISASMPDKLCAELSGAFDKVLVDAPCSGEGMMRKDPKIAENWTKENVVACSIRQRHILDCAAKALRKGGTLVYSTCTFSKEENENTVMAFLNSNPDFALADTAVTFGRNGIGMNKVRRIFPTDGGEGHFVAKFVKSGNEARRQISGNMYSASEKETAEINKFLEENGIGLPPGYLKSINNKYYLSPLKEVPEGIGVIRLGMPLNTPNVKRLVPSHALFASPFVKCKNEINLTCESDELKKFLHGEEIDISVGYKGYIRVLCEGIPLGFSKASGNKLKNFYPKGLRTLVK